MLHSTHFRAYTGNDVIGAELGGAMKNVLAVATGVADGMQLGLNARAGLITRGLNEMLRLGAAIGARSETLMGLAGLGDLVLTCTGDLSRNRRLGLALGRGVPLKQAVAEIGQVVESVETCDTVMRHARLHGLDLPIAHGVQRVLREEITPAEGLRHLLAREQKPEYPPLKLPALEAVRRSPRNFFVVVGARLAENALGYLYPVFGVSYLINNLHVPRNVAIMGTIMGSVALIIGALGFATLSDRIGRRPVYIFGALFSAACAFPFFLLAKTGNPVLIVLAFVIEMGIGSAAMFGPQAVYFAELFGPRLRYSGFAFARELGSIIAGGPAPLIAGLLVVQASGAPWGVCLYVIVLSLITAFAVWCGPETYRSDIRQDDVQDR